MISRLKEIANEVGTPFYLAYPDRFQKNLTDFNNAFKNRYNRFLLSYSFKTNYTPFLLDIVKSNGFIAEVVSEIEYDLAQQVGFKGDRIILNGPIKSEALIEKAILNGSIVNLDCLYEIDFIIDIRKKHPDLPINIGLRVNMEIKTDNGSSAIQGGLKESRFGFTQKILDEIIPKLKENKISVVSLHGHTSSTNRVVENYKIISSRLLEIAQVHTLDEIKYFDLGGGFFGAAPKEVDISKRPSYQDYANGICDVLLNNEWFQIHKPHIVIEPGASVVTNVFELVTRIHQHKTINQKDFVIVDASIYQVRAQTSKVNYPYDEYSEREEEQPITADIVGATCMETDVIANQVTLKHYHYGDFLVFKGSGAYRHNLTPFFINPRCAIVKMTEDGYEVLRKRQDAKHLLDMLQ